MTKKLCTIGSAVVLAGVVALAVRAEAADTTFHGSACQPYSPSAAADIGYSTYGVNNQNKSVYRYVWCPAPASTTSPDATAYGGVSVDDQSTTDGIYCSLYGLGADDSIFYTMGNNTTAAATGNTTLHFHPDKFDGLVYAYFCRIPAWTGTYTSRINTYRFRN
jgi:hypothetical protein